MGTADNGRQNRRDPTEPQRRLWRHLSNSRLGGLKFHRQHVIDSRIVDFFCPSIDLVIKVDGHTHDAGIDRMGDKALAAENYTILRFTNTDAMQDIESVLETILTTARSLPPRNSRNIPPPRPLS